MKKKKLSMLMSMALTAGLLGACGGGETPEEQAGDTGGAEGSATEFTVGMVTDVGGVDDKSFNQSAWEGLGAFGADNGLIEGEGYKYLQSNSASEYGPNLNSLVREDVDLVLGIGFLMGTDVQTIAQQQPDAQLGIVDMVVTDDEGNLIENVANITFKEEQGSFLAGVVAGLQTESNTLGFIGGVKSELIQKFENGFKAGVKAVNPDATISVQYAETFNDAAKGQAIASTMYGSGADVIYHAAGGTGNGVFTEAKNRKKNGEDVWVVGVDRDQHEEGLPENVTLTSMVKRVDQAVYQVAEQTMNGDFPGGQIVEFGLTEQGVGIAETTENVSEEALNVVEEYKEKILANELEVPATGEEYEAFIEAQ